MNQERIRALQLLHAALARLERMDPDQLASNPVLRKMLKTTAKVLASHNAVDEGPTHNLAGVSEKLAEAFQKVRDAPSPTPEQLESLYDAWRDDVEPTQAEVQAVLEGCREAEPDKTWEPLQGKRFKSTMMCPGICKTIMSEDVFEVVLGRDGSWEPFLANGIGTMGWEYDCNGKTCEACVDCVPLMAKEAFYGVKQRICITQILTEPECPQEKITRVAQFLRESYPVADRLFAKCLVQGAWPAMTKARAVELGFPEEAARPERKRKLDATDEPAGKRALACAR